MAEHIADYVPLSSPAPKVGLSDFEAGERAIVEARENWLNEVVWRAYMRAVRLSAEDLGDSRVSEPGGLGDGAQ